MSTNAHSIVTLLTMLEETVLSVSMADLPAFLGEMEKVKALGWGRMLGAPSIREGEGDLLTVPEVAKQLKVSEYRAYELVRRGDIKKTTIGEKSVRVRQSDLSIYLTKQTGST